MPAPPAVSGFRSGDAVEGFKLENARWQVPTMKGWVRFWRRRRKELRHAGLHLAAAGQAATEEVRCRNRIAEVIGKPAALRIELLISVEPGEAADFLVWPPVPVSVRKQLEGISGLQFPAKVKLQRLRKLYK